MSADDPTPLDVLRPSSETSPLIGEVVGDGAGISDDDDVFDPSSPEDSLEVDPRLDREGIAQDDALAVPLHDVRVLVLFHTDAVPGAVDERRPVSRRLSIICRAARSISSQAIARFDGVERGSLCQLENGVELCGTSL